MLRPAAASHISSVFLGCVGRLWCLHLDGREEVVPVLHPLPRALGVEGPLTALEVQGEGHRPVRMWGGFGLQSSEWK